ncbi:DUF4136 domain-containing protein [Ferrimonas lipolytica]|uniref:DUF4136 domain-containing protein n=1 Tax=Ferrimonas lipolytica TaxID=2724191 RepID=A0A6H1UHQ8_9GAMM|nr:DUF4136 domain-containing protein [Ferrimonas lipolytica]QIZ78574.1 DUF4136 domain-containing protein [Ferrimonas lipolytica]
MNHITRLALLLAPLIIAGCSSNKIDIDYQTDVDFNQLNSFVVASSGDAQEPLMMARLIEAATANLANRGWQQTDSEQSNGVTVYISTNKELRAKDPDMKIGVGGGSFGSSGGVSGGVNIPIGASEEQILLLRLDLVQQGELLWRGNNEMRLRGNDSPQKRNSKLTTLVEQLLGQFPPQPVN